MPEASPWFRPLCRLVRAAGVAIKDAQAAGLEARRKQDGSPVSGADDAAEAIILDGLRQLDADIPIIAEEEVAAGRVPAVGARFWLVDALDGTKEFLRGDHGYTVNIGLIEYGVPVLGAVHLPALDLTYYGDSAGAVKLEAAGPAQPIAVRPPPADGLVVMESRSHGDAGRMAEYLAAFHVKAREAVGSSWKICRIAEGTADLYPRFGPTMEWDTAAAHAVLLAAGGHVLDMNGAPLRYGKPEFRNPEFVARGR